MNYLFKLIFDVIIFCILSVVAIGAITFLVLIFRAANEILRETFKKE